MDGFEINKILGAILGTCMFTLAPNNVRRRPCSRPG